LSEKLTFDELKNHLWGAADVLRGTLDASEYRQPIMTLLFLKRLNDRFEEIAEELESQGKSKKTAWEDSDYHAFFIPKETRWKIIADAFENIGEKIDNTCSQIEHINPSLEGVLTNISYNDKKRFPDDDLLNLVSHFNKKRLRNSDLENEDIFGQGYEYLLEQFADSAGKKAGEFFTPREVVKLLVNILKPTEKMLICDPTCGSGGMLIWSRKFIKEHGNNPKNLSLHGQERNYGNYSMCKMNMILHGVENFRIEHENILTNPLLVENGNLIHYDLVLANFPFSMEWNVSLGKNDPYQRFAFGYSSKKYADFAFIQHMYQILKDNGKAAIITSQGVFFREQQEKQIRKKFVELDVIEAIIALPANLFYATGIPACILLLNKRKPKERKNKILFVYAANEFGKGDKRDFLRKKDMEKILCTFENFKEIDRYSHIADVAEIQENEFNLNVPRYVDTSIPDEPIDIQKELEDFKNLQSEISKLDLILKSDLKELKFKL